MTSPGGSLPLPESSNGEAQSAARPGLETSAELTRSERLLRHARQVRLYSSVTAIVALLVVLVLLISVNVRTVKIDWVAGSTHASLVWIVLAATVLGWLLGIATSVSLRHRTRRRHRR
jgi:uncharacterized integral membrane protein